MNASRLLVASVLITLGCGFGCSGKHRQTLDAEGHARLMRKILQDFVPAAKKAPPGEAATMGSEVLESLTLHQKTDLGEYTDTYAQLTTKCEKMIEEGKRNPKASPAVPKLLDEMATLAKKLPE